MNKNIKRVINFSGGRTSALMTILLKPNENDIVLFTDTGREHKATYKFIQDFEINEKIKVHYASHLLGFEKYKTSLPNRVKRMCTVDLKIRTAKKYLKSLGILSFENYIGFRADEVSRVKKREQQFKKVYDKFPLYDWGITKNDVLQYWKNKSYDLNIPSILGNCDLCFLKGPSNIIKILSVYPDLADKWIEDEIRTGKKYLENISYFDMKKIANSQMSLFDLNDLNPAFNCSCNNI